MNRSYSKIRHLQENIQRIREMMGVIQEQILNVEEHQ